MALPNPIPLALKQWLGSKVTQEFNPDFPLVDQHLVSRVRWVLKALDTCFLPWTSQELEQVLDYLVRRCELGDFLYRPTPCGIGVLPPTTGGELPPTGGLLQLLSFTGPTTINLLGNVVSSVTLRWSYNKEVREQTLEETFLPVGIREKTLDNLSLSSPTSYLLEAYDGQSRVQGTVSIRFANHLLFGVGTNLTTLRSLTPQPLKVVESRTQTFTVNAGRLEKVYCGFPLRLGANPLDRTLPQATYTVGAFEGGFLETIIPYTNPAGYTEDYVLAESVNPNLGTLTVSVS